MFTLEQASEPPAGLGKTEKAKPHPESLIQQDWGGAQKFAFLTNFQMMLILLAQRPHLENACKGFHLHYGISTCSC